MVTLAHYPPIEWRGYAPKPMTGDHASARIEPWGDGDLPLLERLVGDPAMMAHLGGPESRSGSPSGRPGISCPGSRQYRIVDPDTGEGAGWVGYWHRDWRGSEVFEIGWSVAPEHQGRGLARAATALVIALARAEPEPRFMHAYPSVDNAPSNAICRRLGFQLAGAIDFGTRRYQYALQRLAARPGRRLSCVLLSCASELRTGHKTGLSS